MEKRKILQYVAGLSGVFLASGIYAAEVEQPADSGQWVDKQHNGVQKKINGWAHGMDDWFGEPDPDNPATANLRLILDSEWNKYDGVSYKPKVRGRVRLPTLEKKVSVVFGDESLDDAIYNENHISPEVAQEQENKKGFSRKQSRKDNASLAVRFSDFSESLSIENDIDLGIRSGRDLYVRWKAAKDWDLGNDYSTRLEQVYRYGIRSRHHARTNWEVKYAPENKPMIANHLHAQYAHDKKSEQWTWGNSLYRQHDFDGNKRLNYGVYAGGDIDNSKPSLNSYGPFAGWRQPVWKKWLFVQTEVSYYNNKKLDRPHHVGTQLRLEAVF